MRARPKRACAVSSRSGPRSKRPGRTSTSTCAIRTDSRCACPTRGADRPMPKENKNLVVGLDIGTSKVACLVAQLRADGALEILGMGNHESKGLKKGVVVNIEATVSAIQRALEEAELMADCKIAAAYVGIAGNHIRSFNSTGMVAAAQNIVKCVRRCGLEVSDLILQPLASSRAVLSEDEKDLGVCLLDIGGGTTDIAVFTHGAIRHTAVIPIAGDQITNDIAMALRTPTGDAETIKTRHGVALRQLADANEMIEVPGIGERAPRMMSRQTLAEVIEPRAEELFSLVQQVLRESGFEELLSSRA